MTIQCEPNDPANKTKLRTVKNLFLYKRNNENRVIHLLHSQMICSTDHKYK